MDPQSHDRDHDGDESLSPLRAAQSNFRKRRLFALLVWVGLAVLAAGAGLIGIERLTRDSRSERAVATHAEELFRALTSLVAGNPDGDVSIVVFHDYNCPYCRKDAPALSRLVAEDGSIRLVVKELPVLGRDSEDAARVVLAAKGQGSAVELHERLLGIKGRASKLRALHVAEQLGLDRTRLEREMNDPQISSALSDNRLLADALGVRSVPFYLVGDRVISDRSPDLYELLRDEVTSVRSEGCRVAC